MYCRGAEPVRRRLPTGSVGLYGTKISHTVDREANAPGGRRRFYLVGAALMVLWAAVLLALARRPDPFWYSYYAVDYTVGFVRRGLAGELAAFVSGEDGFAGQRIGRWLSSAAYILGLVGLAWWVAIRSGRSERRLQLAFLVAVLPFGVAFGLLQAGSTLFGGAALVGFAMAVAAATSDRCVLVASAVYGLLTAVATLIHEATPLLYGPGVVVALVVLAHQVKRPALWTSCALALGPGLATALAVAVFGRRGVSRELCELVPRARVTAWAHDPATGQLITGHPYSVDYREWVCRTITPMYDMGFVDAIGFVNRLGTATMAANTAVGIGAVAITVLAIREVSGVPLQRMRTPLTQRWPAVVIAFCLITPVFMTGIDWVRWWVVIAFDIGIVYLLYASSQPEVDLPPTRRTTRVFALVVVLSALVPVGVIPGLGAPHPG